MTDLVLSVWCFLPQVSLSSSMLDIYGGEQGMNAPKGGMSPTSNPTKLTVKREYTGMNPYHSLDLTTKHFTHVTHITHQTFDIS